ncbi:MAG: aldehyde dehydrogenase family protein [Gammaproteobacteria bacterium]|nr:aldehyde dehydrogenase family protein [Gammaproteobacteria bacterium]
MQPIDVVNPWSGIVDYQFVPPTADELAAEAARLRRAQLAWRNQTLGHRVDVLSRFRETLLARREPITAALAADTGRHLVAVAELLATAGAIDRWCRQAPALMAEADGRSVQTPSIRYRNQWVPYALVGVISPWNFPLTLALIDAIPALLAGCAVLIKPSEITPRFVEPLAEAIAAVPELAEVLSFRPGAGETGAQLVTLVDAVCFTGSVRTGRIVGEAAARAFIPAFLELGGKDPAIVTASADLERAAIAIVRGSVLANGQACQSLERVYVHESVYEDFVARVVARASAVTINWPDPAKGVSGPFIWARQGVVVQQQINDAIARGARVLCGGQVEDHGGKWLLPTVLVDVTHDMLLMNDETFGPVIPVMKYRSEDEAVELANFGVYGLSAAVFAGTEDEALRIAERIDAGGVSINDAALTGVMHECEKHSFKCSGLGGSRMGPSGFTRFFRRKALIVQEAQPTPIAAFDETLLAR